MKWFVLIEIHDIRRYNKYRKKGDWKQIDVLPYFSGGYTCFSKNETLPFQDLIDFFLVGDDDHRIGSMSIIAEQYPFELFRYLCDNDDFFSSQNVHFLSTFVIPTYLPSRVCLEQFQNCCFDERLSGNVWVRILEEVRTHM